MIKERNSGVSRGFAFIDFPSVVPFFSLLLCVLGGVGGLILTIFSINFDELTTRE